MEPLLLRSFSLPKDPRSILFSSVNVTRETIYVKSELKCLQRFCGGRQSLSGENVNKLPLSISVMSVALLPAKQGYVCPFLLEFSLTRSSSEDFAC